ncbi:MAG: site-specific integrase [Sedimentisphaerales bacterium]|jgi:integrase
MKQLVKLWKRPSYDGARFTYYLLYTDEQGKRKQKTLGHTDARKAERQRAQMECQLRMGTVELGSKRLSEFLSDNLERTRGQVRQSTLYQARIAMEHFIKVVGNIDCRSVKHEHGELFVQACLDKGNTPATAAKKLRHLKRLFQLGVDRGQLDENSIRRVKQPRRPQKKVRVFNTDECSRLIQAGKQLGTRWPLKWELLFRMALCTGMRRGELLNTTWKDIDFEHKSVDVSPKKDVEYMWEWHIKDTDRRTLPLTDELVRFLAEHQATQPEKHPYLFIPADRYDYIQRLRNDGKWSVQQGCCPVNNFDRQFKVVLKTAGIENGGFHDLRRTCLTNWFTNGLNEHDVMTMAGHANFETTRRFYLAVRDDLLERTRQASSKAMAGISVANLLQVPFQTKE